MAGFNGFSPITGNLSPYQPNQFTGYPHPTNPFMQNGINPTPNFNNIMQSQNQMQIPQQQFQNQYPQTQPFDWIRVNTLDDIKSVTVNPGEKAWIMLKNDPIFAVKIADSMGMANTEYFKFEPYDPSSEKSKNPVIYATIDDINELRSEIEALKGGNNRVKSVKQPVQSSTTTE